MEDEDAKSAKGAKTETQPTAEEGYDVWAAVMRPITPHDPQRCAYCAAHPAQSATKKLTPEELWEAAGYLRAADDAIDAALDVEAADDVLAPDAAAAAYERGAARWRAEHPEAKP
jgi:hypothetical protein